MLDMQSALSVMHAKIGVFEATANKPGFAQVETMFYDRHVAARGSELGTYRHYVDRAMVALQQNKAVLVAQHPEVAGNLGWVDELFQMLAAMDRLIALHFGALSVAQNKGWAVYNQYTANLRPYASNPPASWANFDFAVLDPRQLKLANEMCPPSARSGSGSGSQFPSGSRRFNGKRHCISFPFRNLEPI
jgi:hypothetical protein